MTFHTRNPATGDTLADYEPAEAGAIEDALDRATAAYRDWSQRSFEARGAVIAALADRLDARAEELARLGVAEMGKPITQMRGEIAKCAALCRHMATAAAGYLADEPQTLPDGPFAGARAKVVYDPLGPVFSITPWNFPIWQVVRFGIPALSAGNVIVHKHAPNVIGCGLFIAELALEAGAPEGVFQSLVLTNDQAAAVIADERIVGVGLTGSERAGASVAATAGDALKKVVLELGGSDPFIVLADADVDAAAKAGATSRFVNTGQVCVSAKRFIVEAPAADAFKAAFVRETKALALGDPMDETSFMGPMARRDLRDGIARQWEATRKSGGDVLLDGGPMEGPGDFFAPCIIAEPDGASPALREETFGPLAAIVTAADAEDALRLANDTRYGLSANLWTQDLDRAEALARRIEAGGVFINATTTSDLRLPFGGIKRSGIGRELGPHGTREFTNVKTVVMREG